MNNKLTEETLIPLSFLTAVIGFVFWLTSIHLKADNATASIREIQAEIDVKKDKDSLFEREVLERLARIEEALKRKKER